MKKTFSVIKNVLVWTLVAVAVFMMIFTVVSVSTFDKNDRAIFGYKAYIVKSDSMSSVNGDTSKGYFSAGDLIFVKEVDLTTVKEGDIISYISTNTDNYGETVTHMVKSLANDAEGNNGFVTYGTATGATDANIVIYPYVLGKYSGKLAGVGTFFEFLKTTPGYIICIFLPFVLLIVIQGLNSVRLFKKYKAEQMAEIEAAHEKERAELEEQRKALEEERKRQEELMQKLLDMQATMEGNKPEEKSDSAPDSDK